MVRLEVIVVVIGRGRAFFVWLCFVVLGRFRLGVVVFGRIRETCLVGVWEIFFERRDRWGLKIGIDSSLGYGYFYVFWCGFVGWADGFVGIYFVVSFFLW